MFAPGQRSQHGQPVGLVHGLAENSPVDHHRGIRAQDTTVLAAPFQHSQPGGRLAARQALDVGGGRFVRQGGLVDSGGEHGQRHADLGQQFTATGRGGGEIQRRHGGSRETRRAMRRSPVSKNDDIRRSIAAKRTYLTLRRRRTNCSRAYIQGQSSALTRAGSRKVRVGGRLPVRALSQSWSSCARP